MAEVADPYLLLSTAQKLFGKAPGDLAEDELAQIRAQVLRQQQLQKAVLATAEAEDIEVDAEQLSASLDSLAEAYPSRSAFLGDLARNGLNESRLKIAVTESLMVERVLDKVAASASLSDDEVTAFYEANLDKFNMPERRQARHILITINSQFPENRRKAVKARMQKIAAELEQHPDRFDALARRHSECPTAMEGGVLGTLTQGTLYAELDRMLFAMNEGEISEPVESPMGLHLLICDAILPAGAAALDEAAEKIRAHLLSQRQKEAQRSWLKNLQLQKG